MDNFTHKNRRPSSPRVSIDGISPSHKVRTQGSIGGMSRARPVATSPRPLDNFKRSEGLNAAQSGSVLEVKARPHTEKTSKKRKLFSRKKRDPKLDGVDRYGDKLARKQRRRKLAAFACVFVLVFGVFGYGYIKKIFSGGGGAAALQENVDPSKLRGEGDGRVNILLLGRGGDGAEAPDLTDTMILVSIDPVNNEAGLVSIPRDLYVNVPNFGSMKINQVFYTGKSSVINNNPGGGDVSKQADEKGFELTKSSVEDVLGIPIHYRAMMDFSGFKEAIDTVGGIDVNVPKRVRDQMQFDGKPYLLDVRPGWKHFDGFEALAYTRSRYNSAGGDFERSERQRLVIIALKEKILTVGTFSNPAKIVQLIDNLGSHVSSDFGFSDFQRLYEITQKIDSSKINSLDFVTPPHDFLTTENIGGLSVVLPKAGVDDYSAIHNYIRNTLRDGYLKNENASLTVLNGTDRAGLGTEKSIELKSYGYNVDKVENAPTRNYASTILVDMRSGQKKYTKRYLEQRFGVAATTTLPQGIDAGTADFVIILGNDTRTSGQ